MRNLKLTLCYDGTNYHGWQIQPGLKTVQGEVTRAIKEIFKEDAAVYGSSRTDAGVHAKEYVCNFKTSGRIPENKVPSALNTKLPCDIRVLSCSEESDGFHARKSAKNKTYRYVVTDKYDVFTRNYRWYFPFKLDFEKMQKEAESYVGTHDFTGFMSSGGTFDTTVKTINFVNLKNEDGLITIDINGNGFLYNMVRIMAGTLVCIGAGRINESLSDIINLRDRKKGGITAPAHGLSLIKVNY